MITVGEPGNSAAPVAQPKTRHFGELDSLRGLAALIVVFYHGTHLWPDGIFPRWLQVFYVSTPLSLLTGGHASVVLFFVLSGFVLSLPQVRGNEIHYGPYLIKRICRIYLPYAAALVLAVMGCYWFHGLDAYNEWFQRTWHAAPNFHLIVQHVLLVGEYPSDSYNTAFWSLVQEMRLSFIFPLLCWVVLRVRFSGSVCLILSLLGFEAFADRSHLLSLGGLNTLVCVTDFIVGILLAAYLPQLGDWLSTLGRKAYWSVLAVSLALYTYTSWAAYHLRIHVLAKDIGVAIGAAGIILFTIVHAPIRNAMLKPSAIFLGKISYSIYLLHGTVLFVFAYLLHDRLSPLVWFFPYIAISITAAAVMYRTVEVPSMSTGKYLASRLRRTEACILPVGLAASE